MVAVPSDIPRREILTFLFSSFCRGVSILGRFGALFDISSLSLKEFRSLEATEEA
jgi:hypothetical protein